MKEITAFDYLTPLNDEDPLGVFEFEPLVTELTDAMQAIETRIEKELTKLDKEKS